MVEKLSLVLQVCVYFFSESKWMPKAQPEVIQKRIMQVATVVSTVATGTSFAIGPGALPFNPLYFCVLLVLLAVATPMIGRCEAKRTSSEVFGADRFWPHLISNFAGSLAVSAFVLAGRATPGFGSFSKEFNNQAAYNIVLPVTVVTVLALVRSQQIDRCPSLDRLVAENRDDPSAWESQIAGYSLRHWHQKLNVAYLVLVIFSGATMILYLFAFTMEQSKGPSPLPASPQIIAAVALLIVFLLACGVIGSRRVATELKALGAACLGKVGLGRLADKFAGNPTGGTEDRSGKMAVYMTFLTGTPATLVVSLIWFALLAKSRVRDVSALLIIGIGYGVYTFFAIAGTSRDGQRLQVHYFSAAIFAGLLIVISGAVYYSS